MFLCIEGTVSRDVEAVLMDGPHPFTKVEACRIAKRLVEQDAFRATFVLLVFSDEAKSRTDMTVVSKVFALPHYPIRFVPYMYITCF